MFLKASKEVFGNPKKTFGTKSLFLSNLPSKRSFFQGTLAPVYTAVYIEIEKNSATRRDSNPLSP